MLGARLTHRPSLQAHYKQFAGTAPYDAWQTMFAGYKAAHPEKAAELERRIAGELPEGFLAALPRNTPEEEKYPKKATRQQSQIVLNELANVCPEIIGGSADLTPSNLTALTCSGARCLARGLPAHGARCCLELRWVCFQAISSDQQRATPPAG